MKVMVDKFIVFPESRNRNAQYWGSKSNLTKGGCELAVRDIVGLVQVPNFETAGEARIFFLYAVDYLWVGELGEPTDVWNGISDQVKKSANKYPWDFRDIGDEGESSLVVAPSVVHKKKKQSNGDTALEWWEDNLESLKGLAPSAIQDRMAEECDILRNSCRGLYYACKKKVPLS